MPLTKQDLFALGEVIIDQVLYITNTDIYDKRLSKHKQIRINQLQALHQKVFNVIEKEYEK